MAEAAYNTDPTSIVAMTRAFRASEALANWSDHDDTTGRAVDLSESIWSRIVNVPVRNRHEAAAKVDLVMGWLEHSSLRTDGTDVTLLADVAAFLRADA